jgi:hypothetical protein
MAPFLITPNNFFVAYSHVVQEQERMNFEIHSTSVRMDVCSENNEYWDLLPESLAGRNRKRLEAADLNKLMEHAQAEASDKMVSIAVERIARRDCVFLVAKNARHVDSLAEKLGRAGITNVYCIRARSDAISLTEQTMQLGGAYKRYDCVISSNAICTGYSVTIANVQIGTLYFSNSAVREQMRGRIKRLGSKWTKLSYITVLCGKIMDLVDKRYDLSDSFASVLRDLNTGRR